jgi:hypothetical protein
VTKKLPIPLIPNDSVLKILEVGLARESPSRDQGGLRTGFA